VPSKISTPSRSGITARRRRQTAAALHGASVMKCWNAWSDPGSVTRASIASMDLRALSLSTATLGRTVAARAPARDARSTLERLRATSSGDATDTPRDGRAPRCRVPNSDDKYNVLKSDHTSDGSQRERSDKVVLRKGGKSIKAGSAVWGPLAVKTVRLQNPNIRP
jgi:hypothetical protein